MIRWELVTAWALVFAASLVLWGLLALAAYGVYLLVT